MTECPKWVCVSKYRTACFFFFCFFLPSNLWNNSEPFSYPHGTISVFCAGPHYKVCYNKDQEKPHCRKWESAQCSGYSSNIYKAHKFIPNVTLCIGVWSSFSSAHYAQLHSKYIVMSFTLVKSIKYTFIAVQQVWYNWMQLKISPRIISICLRLKKCESAPEGGRAALFKQQSRAVQQELPADICCAVSRFIEVSDATIFYVCLNTVCFFPVAWTLVTFVTCDVFTLSRKIK